MSLFIATHMGMGDMILQNGLVRTLTDEHDEVFVPCIKKYEESARFMYQDEPNQRYVECLKHNCPTAEIFSLGLSDSTGPCRMNIGVGGNTGAGAITPDGEVESRMMRLDDLGLPRLDFLKLDVEGYELKALIGGSETVKRCRPIIQMEWNIPAMLRAGVQPASVEEWLTGAGYHFRYFNGTRETGGELFAQLS